VKEQDRLVPRSHNALEPLITKSEASLQGSERESEQLSKSEDQINPSHYKSHPSGVECIEVTRHMNFNLGNAMKYIWRHDKKHGVQDLRKAIWYLEDEIARLTHPNDRQEPTSV
jgi:hypothetical protein